MPFENNSPRIVDRLAKTTYVVLIKVDGKTSLILDPGLGKPWRGQGVFGKKRGDDIARDAEAHGYKAECRTWEEAFSLLVKEAGGPEQLEALLYDKLVQKQISLANPPPNKIRLRE